MRSVHDFVVGGDVEDVWRELQDIKTFIRCFPGASTTEAGALEVKGSLVMKVGAVAMRFLGTAEYAETDHEVYRLVVQVHGRDSRLGLAVDATVVLTLDQSDRGAAGRAAVDLQARGVPTALAHGLLEELGHDLWDQFADCLSDTVHPDRLLPAEDRPRPPLDEEDLPPEFKPKESESLADEVSRILEGDEPEDPGRPAVAARRSPPPETESEIDLLSAAPGPIMRRLRRQARGPASWWGRRRRPRRD